MDGTHAPSGLTLTAFALATVLGGGNFLAVRFSNRELEPFWGAGLRFSLAAVLFVAIVLSLRLRWPRGAQLRTTMLYGLFTFALSYALMYWALVRVSAGAATVVLAIVPLVTLLLATLQGLERLRRRTLVGASLALIGIAWMSLGPADVAIPLSGLVAMLLAALTIGQAVILGKRVAGNHPAATNAVGMLTGAAALLALSAVAGERWALPTQPEVAWSVAYLVTLGSVGLFVLTLLVVRRWTASATSYLFVLFPLVTMLLEAMMTDEPLTLQGVTGALVVMAGVWFGALTRPGTRPTDRESATAPAPAR